MRTSRTSALLTAAALAAAALPQAPAWASDPFAGLDALAGAELGALRGGMLVGGLEVNFAVVVKTTVEGANGPLGLQTTVSVGDAGQLAQAITTAVGVGGNVTDGAGGTTLTSGGTAISHNVVRDQIQSMIANTTSGRTISQSTDLNVSLPGFNTVSQTYQVRQHVSRLGYDASLVGLGRY